MRPEGPATSHFDQVFPWNFLGRRTNAEFLTKLRAALHYSYFYAPLPQLSNFVINGHHNIDMNTQLRQNNRSTCFLLCILRTVKFSSLSRLHLPRSIQPSSYLYQDQPALPAKILSLEKFKDLICWDYRVIQRERSIFWDVIVSVIVRQIKFIWACVWW